MKARSQSSSTLTRRFKSSSRKQRAERWSRTSVLRELKRLASPKVRAKMAYFGVKVQRRMEFHSQFCMGCRGASARTTNLPSSCVFGIHEARILATLIGESDKVTRQADGTLGARV